MGERTVAVKMSIAALGVAVLSAIPVVGYGLSSEPQAIPMPAHTPAHTDEGSITGSVKVKLAKPPVKAKAKATAPSRPARRPAPVTAAVPVSMPVPAPGHLAGSAKVALLIGINNAPGSTPLEGSITDVENMRKTLMGFGWKAGDIEVLTEGAASRSGILAGLDRFAARSRSGGTAVFLLATHSGQSGGNLTFATGGGGRISRHELASKLGGVRGRLWSMLPTCYSEGYALPGVIGRDRIAVFSSSADEYTWQLGGAGSWLVLYMVRYALLEGRSPEASVEGAFRWATKKLGADAPNRRPILSDGIDGDLVLGEKPSTSAAKPAEPKPKPKAEPKPKAPVATPAPTPTPAARNCGLVGLLGCRR